MEDKHEKRADAISAEIPDEMPCYTCKYGRHIEGPCYLACVVECKLNPLKPVLTGFMAKHSSRKKRKYIFYSVFPNEEVMNIALKNKNVIIEKISRNNKEVVIYGL